MKKAQTISIPFPGSKGITEENRFGINDPQWAKKAENFIIDQNGALKVRTGFTLLANVGTLEPTFANIGLKSIWPFHMVNEAPNDFGGFINGETLTVFFVQWTGTLVGSPVTAIEGVFRGASSDGNGDLMTLNNTGGDETYWQFSEVYSGTEETRLVVAFHDGLTPGVWDPADITYSSNVATDPGSFSNFNTLHPAWEDTTVYSVGDTVRDTGDGGNTDPEFYFYASTGGTSGGTEPTWDFTDGEDNTDGTVVWRSVKLPVGGVAHWAFGRLWGVDESHTVLYFSGVTEPASFFGVNGGTLDLKKTEGFLNGVDRVIAISSYGDNLIIFGRNSVLIYNNNPTNFALQEVIPNVGCLARDTVVNVENDIIWLDEGGLRSLRRNAVAPDRRLELYSPSRHNREQILEDIETLYAKDEPQYLPQAAYDRRKGLYVLSLEDRVWCFDLKYPNQDGTLRTTTWVAQDGSGDTTVSGLCYDNVAEVLTANIGAVRVAYQEGGTDIGTVFDASWESAWWDFGISGEKIVKSLHYHIGGGNTASFTARWAQDFIDTNKTGSVKTLTSNVDHIRQPASGIGEQWSFGGNITSTNTNTIVYSMQVTVVMGSTEGL